MKIKRIEIDNIPSKIWGEYSEKVFIAVHGNMSNKQDKVIKILAEEAVKKCYQVLSFDLPEQGERKDDKEYPCKAQNCVKDLKKIIEYVQDNYAEASLWACSMGAYFSLLAYKNEDIKHCLFLSPVVNIKSIIDNMMTFSGTTVEDLKEKKEIRTDFGQTLYWDYYEYVLKNPIEVWDKETHILYGTEDNMQDRNTIRGFCDRFHCKLSVMEKGEQFFHTEEQLSFYKNRLNKTLE